MNRTTLIRFQKYIELDLLEGCWLWQGAINHDGYGLFWHEEKMRGAHRTAFEHWNGKVLEGLELDHLCRNRQCVNPDHLEIVTHKENVQRGRSFLGEKTHCPQGHPYSGENLVIRLNGRRTCKICSLEQSRRNHIRERSQKVITH